MIAFSQNPKWLEAANSSAFDARSLIGLPVNPEVNSHLPGPVRFLFIHMLLAK